MGIGMSCGGASGSRPKSAIAVRGWRSGPVAAFMDVDTGGGRTGIFGYDPRNALAILDELRSGGFEFLGLHSYDGHLADLPESDQQEAVARELRELVSSQNDNIRVIVTNVRDMTDSGRSALEDLKQNPARLILGSPPPRNDSGEHR